MKAKIDKNGCLACGQCESICPEVFRMGSDGLAEVYTDPIPDSVIDSAKEARDNCPGSVITIEE